MKKTLCILMCLLLILTTVAYAGSSPPELFDSFNLVSGNYKGTIGPTSYGQIEYSDYYFTGHNGYLNITVSDKSGSGKYTVQLLKLSGLIWTEIDRKVFQEGRTYNWEPVFGVNDKVCLRFTPSSGCTLSGSLTVSKYEP